MGCCENFCKVSITYNNITKKQNEQLEENLSQKILVENDYNNDNKNVLLINSLPAQEEIKNQESKPNINKFDKNLKNFSQ